jgi:hypothetical protein
MLCVDICLRYKWGVGRVHWGSVASDNVESGSNLMASVCSDSLLAA